MNKKKRTIIAIAIAWTVLTFAMLTIDYLGVRVLNHNGLVFEVHIYWYGLSAFISLAAFWVAVHWIGQTKLSILSTTVVTIVTVAWWLLTFCMLMMTHGLIGGWY
ncbi:MAG: hypothetical protein PHR77_16580 [Kiritimatiellae bacterium]|nr:hypothetical protein [Kiritimatiellia bacterium]MDD5521617.1 hypothetical protein [Kiritimatiellia bacterium]